MLKHLNEPKTISEAALYPNLYIYRWTQVDTGGHSDFPG